MPASGRPETVARLSILARSLAREGHLVLRDAHLLTSHLHNTILIDEGEDGAAGDLLREARRAHGDRPWLRLTDRPPPAASRHPMARVLDLPSSVQALAWSPDGRHLATGGFDDSVQLWDRQGGAPRLLAGHDPTGELGHREPVVALAWPTPTSLASASLDGTAQLWNPESGTRGGRISGGGRVFDVAAAPDGERFATAHEAGSVGVLSTTGAHATLEATGRIFTVAWSPDGRWLAAGGDATTVWVWDARDGALAASLQGHTGWVQAVAWSPDGRTLATAGRDPTIRRWSTGTWDRLPPLGGAGPHTSALAWSPTGGELASAGWDRAVVVWDVAAGRPRTTYLGHVRWINALAWSPDGARLASADADGQVVLWDTATDGSTPAGHDAEVRTVALSPDGRLLASGGGGEPASEPGHRDTTVRLWAVPSGAPLGCLEGHDDAIMGLVWSPDGRTLASGSQDRTVRLWDPTAATLRTVAFETGGYVMAWSPDGTVASTAGDDRILLKDPSWRTIAALEGHTAPVTALAWSPDGGLLASGGRDGAILLWRRGTVLTRLEGASRQIHALAWSPDGQLLGAGSGISSVALQAMTRGTVEVRAAGAQVGVPLTEATGLLERVKDCTVRCWQVTTGELRAELRGHRDPVRALAWSADGAVLASAGEDRAVHVWDVANGRRRGTAYGRSWLLDVHLDADGTTVLVVDDGATTGNRPILYRFDRAVPPR
jgi:WD40 repeat protein